VRSKQLHDTKESTIAKQCKEAIAKYTRAEQMQFLTDANKISDMISTADQTEAISTMSDAEGDEKEYYDSASEMNGVDLKELIGENEEEVEEAEALLDNLHKRNTVLNYLMENKNSIKKARALFCKCILEMLMESNGDDV
jgi:hypothetical protein